MKKCKSSCNLVWSIDHSDWIRNQFVEFEQSEKQLTLTEEDLTGFLNDRTLKLKYFEINLNAFWLKKNILQ